MAIATESLSDPIATLMRPSMRIESTASLAAAIELLRQQGLGILPVVKDQRVIGIFTDAGTLRAHVESADLNQPVEDFVETEFRHAKYFEPLSRGLAMMQEAGGGVLVVLDDQDRLAGLLTATDLFPRRTPRARPQTIGGMATPLGVYLTNTIVSAGPGPWALVLGGAVLGGLATAAHLIVVLLLVRFGAPLTQNAGDFIEAAGTLLLFLLGLRLIPMSGIHAAEHMVVHAIERGEDLVPEVVARMPRVHPRCGTNLAVGAFIFLTIDTIPWIASAEIRLIVAAVATFWLWRRLGGIAQYWVTTRPPTAKHIRLGIRSGEELLRKVASSRRSRSNFFLWIYNTGLLQVAAGATAVSTLYLLVMYLLGLQSYA